MFWASISPSINWGNWCLSHRTVTEIKWNIKHYIHWKQLISPTSYPSKHVPRPCAFRQPRKASAQGPPIISCWQNPTTRDEWKNFPQMQMLSHNQHISILSKSTRVCCPWESSREQAVLGPARWSSKPLGPAGLELEREEKVCKNIPRTPSQFSSELALPQGHAEKEWWTWIPNFFLFLEDTGYTFQNVTAV